MSNVQLDSSYGSDSEKALPLLTPAPTPPDSYAVSPAVSDCEAFSTSSSSSSTAGEDDSGLPQRSLLVRAATHVVARLGRTVKTANWPVFLAFSSCAVILLRALSGQGYVPPPSSEHAPPLQPNDNLLPPPLSSDPSDNTSAWSLWRKLLADVKAEMEENRESWVGPDGARRRKDQANGVEMVVGDWWTGADGEPRPVGTEEGWEASADVEEGLAEDASVLDEAIASAIAAWSAEELDDGAGYESDSADGYGEIGELS